MVILNLLIRLIGALSSLQSLISHGLAKVGALASATWTQQLFEEAHVLAAALIILAQLLKILLVSELASLHALHELKFELTGARRRRRHLLLVIVILHLLHVGHAVEVAALCIARLQQRVVRHVSLDGLHGHRKLVRHLHMHAQLEKCFPLLHVDGFLTHGVRVERVLGLLNRIICSKLLRRVVVCRGTLLLLPLRLRSTILLALGLGLLLVERHASFKRHVQTQVHRGRLSQVGLGAARFVIYARRLRTV